MKNLFLVSCVPLFMALPTFASGVKCSDSSVQDSQITATFKSTESGLLVTLQIPTGETSTETATGSCFSEEDSSALALQCPNVMTKSGKKYFARIDGRKATVAQNGRILSEILCTGHL